MAHLSDLPDELISYIFSFLHDETVATLQPSGAVRKSGQLHVPFLSRSRRSRATFVLLKASLMLVSRRMYKLARPLLRRDLLFSTPQQISRFVSITQKSAKKARNTDVSVERDVVKTVKIRPKGKVGDTWEDRLLEYRSFRPYFRDVESVMITAPCASVPWSLADPELYLSLAGAFNPTSLQITTDWGPLWDDRMIDYTWCILDAGDLVGKTLRWYSQLEKLEICYLDLNDVSDVNDMLKNYQPFMDMLQRLPLRQLNFTWPIGLTPSKIVNILVILASRPEPRGLTITSQPGNQPPAQIPHPDTSAWFLRQNHGTTLSEVKQELERLNRMDLLGLLTCNVEQ